MIPSLTVIANVKIKATQRIDTAFCRRIIPPGKRADTFHAQPMWAIVAFSKRDMDTFFAQAVYTGTVIVAVRTDREIIVGADSKSTKLGSKRESLLECKIVQVGKVFFAFAKLSRDTAGTFDVRLTATEAIRQGGTIEDIALRFAQLIASPLTRLFSELKRESPSIFREVYGSGTGTALDVIFFGIEDQALRLHLCCLMPSPDLQRVQVTLEEHGNNNAVAHICLGSVEQIQPILDKEPDYFIRRGLLRGITNLVQLAIDGSPENCGPPICILRVNRTGATWIKKAPHCQPTQAFETES